MKKYSKTRVRDNDFGLFYTYVIEGLKENGYWYGIAWSDVLIFAKARAWWALREKVKPEDGKIYVEYSN